MPPTLARKGMGKVARVSGELDTKTRTQLTEVDFDNGKGEFIPGSFVNVSLLIPAKSYVEVPAPALIMREGKRMVAVVGPDSHIKLTPITVAGTDGKVIRIESGLDENVTRGPESAEHRCRMARRSRWPGHRPSLPPRQRSRSRRRSRRLPQQPRVPPPLGSRACLPAQLRSSRAADARRIILAHHGS